jgi:hypothetical protein
VGERPGCHEAKFCVVSVRVFTHVREHGHTYKVDLLTNIPACDIGQAELVDVQEHLALLTGRGRKPRLAWLGQQAHSAVAGHAAMLPGLASDAEGVEGQAATERRISLMILGM